MSFIWVDPAFWVPQAIPERPIRWVAVETPKRSLLQRFSDWLEGNR